MPLVFLPTSSHLAQRLLPEEEMASQFATGGTPPQPEVVIRMRYAGRLMMLRKPGHLSCALAIARLRFGIQAPLVRFFVVVARRATEIRDQDAWEALVPTTTVLVFGADVCSLIDPILRCLLTMLAQAHGFRHEPEHQLQLQQEYQQMVAAFAARRGHTRGPKGFVRSGACSPSPLAGTLTRKTRKHPVAGSNNGHNATQAARAAAILMAMARLRRTLAAKAKLASAAKTGFEPGRITVRLVGCKYQR